MMIAKNAFAFGSRGWRLLGASSTLLPFFVAAPASAETASSTISVSSTVSATCSVSTTPVLFGTIDPTAGSTVDATGGISVTCTPNTSWSAAASIGSGNGASLANRRMALSGDADKQIGYSLFTDPTRTSVWGDGTASTAVISDVGTGAAQSKTIYGRVPGSQSPVPAGAYGDTVAVTVSY